MAGRSSGGFGWLLALLALGAVVQVVKAVARWVEQHPVLATFAAVGITVLIIAGIAAMIAARRRATARQAESERRQAELERSISSADGLTGLEFEHWFMRLLERTGFTEIQHHGGPGDLGADVIATSPLGQRAVFQCKRYRKNVPSGEVQRFGGTCYTIHRADIAAVVTTAGFGRPAQELAPQLGIVLVDRDQLAAWAADYLPPDAFGSAPNAAPAVGRAWP